MEVEFEKHGIKNREDEVDFVRDRKKEDLDFCRKILGGVSNPD